MNTLLSEYNQALGKISRQIGFNSLFSPTLCRVEGQTNLFRTIYIKKDKKKISIIFIKDLIQNSIKYSIGFLLKPMRDIIIRSYSKKNTEKIRTNLLFITYGDKRNYSSSNNWREEIFRGLIPNENDYLLVIPVGKKLKDIIKTIKFINKCNNNNNKILNIYQFIKIEDVLIASLIALKAYVISLNGLIHNKAIVGDKEITRDIIFSLTKDYLSGTIYTNCLYYKAFTRLLKINNISCIIYPWECQCWERLLIRRTKDNKLSIKKQTNSIGYQHTGFSYGLLQHFPTESDSQLSINPDYILTAGEIQKNKLEEIDGLKTTKIQTLGSLRCESRPNIKELNKIKTKLELKRICLVLGYNQSNYDKIIKSIKTINNSISIDILLHPLNYTYIPNVDLPDNLRLFYKKEDILFRDIDMLIVDDNSFIIEGWSIGIPTTILDSDIFNLTKRDWGSPMIHLNLYKLKNIHKKNFIEQLKISTTEYLVMNYSYKYFVETNSKLAKSLINTISGKLACSN